MNESENTERQLTYNTHPNPSNETLFYAVYIPPEYKDEKEVFHIYPEMQSALKVIQSYKKGRLKIFKNYFDAVAYVRTGYEQPSGNYSTVLPTTVTQEKSSNFKAPETQELQAFKRLIKNGDLECVKTTVWKNPRYLISSGDTPAIIQMGSRYNALHVAANKNKPQMCEFILNTVGDPKFMQWHYGEDECKTYLNPAQIMQDLYLNTPDKGLNETPLHFAVKYGYKDVVRVLVSYSQCIKTLPNKYQQLPVDVICSRKHQEDENLKREIRLLLEDQFYVPVLRAEGNACPPIIGEPFSPTSPVISSLNRDPISPRVEVRAFAGPMTKSQAVEFRKKWKTPPRGTPKKGQGDALSIVNSPSLALRLQDMEKGLERVGRELAEECQVPWKEYWPFLKDFVDFRSDEGLAKLEKYLEERYKNKEPLLYSMRNRTNNANTYVPSNCQQMSEKTITNEVQDLCDKLRLGSLVTEVDEIEDNTESLEYFTPPSSPELIEDDSDDDMQNAEEGPVMFIEGSSPTKLDHAVYNALSSMIYPDTYPYIYRWRHDMQLAMQRDPHRFTNMRLLRKKLFANN